MSGFVWLICGDSRGRAAAIACAVVSVWLVLGVAGSASVSQETVLADRGVPYLQRAGLTASFDVIRPRELPNGAGVIYFATGCWVSLAVQAEVFAQEFEPLISAGFTVFVVRHLNEERGSVPSVVADLRVAVARIMELAATYGVAASRIGLLGTSAGGHVALTIGLATAGRATGRIGAVVAFFAPTDLRLLPKQLCRALDFPGEEVTAINPISLVSEKSPPTLLISGDRDELVPVEHSETMHTALLNVGVTSEFIKFPGMGHGTLFGAVEPYQKQGLARATAWFVRHLVP